MNDIESELTAVIESLRAAHNLLAQQRERGNQWRKMADELAGQLDIVHIAYRNYYAGAILRHEWEAKVEVMWQTLRRYNELSKD